MRPPKNILLATDLSSHSDRALDRAAMLARQWRATLHIVHAIQPEISGVLWPSAASALQRSITDSPAIGEAEFTAVQRQVQNDLRGPVDAIEIHTDVGNPADVIMETATQERCELIIIGSNCPSFAGLLLNGTTAQLLHSSTQAILIVKTRPHKAYRRLLIGTDFTAESRHGLETAIHWFENADYALVHSYDMPYSSVLLAADRDHDHAATEHEKMQSFVADTELHNDIRRRIHTHVLHGPPESTLRARSLAGAVDLTVVGALKRGLASRLFIGSNAERIAQTVAGDILMVRAAKDTAV